MTSTIHNKRQAKVWLAEQLKGINDPNRKFKEMEKLLKSLANTDGEAASKQETAFANSSVKRFQTWDRIGNLYLSIVELIEDQKKVTDEVPKSKDIVERVCKATSLQKGMINRCVNISKFAAAYPVAHAMFLTSLDKENMFKLVKKAEATNPQGDDADRKQIEINRGKAMVAVLDAIEEYNSKDDDWNVPHLNAKGTKAFVRDFTEYKDRIKDSFGNYSFDVPAFADIGNTLLREYGAELMPRRPEPDPKTALSGQHIRMYMDAKKGNAYTEGTEGDRRKATATEKHLATAIELLLKMLPDSKAVEADAYTVASQILSKRTEDAAITLQAAAE